jgi:phage I-like protein
MTPTTADFDRAGLIAGRREARLPLASQPPAWFQVFPAGEVLIDGEEPAVMDAEGAALILEQFRRRSHDLVIDYEHQTLSGERAPAAGWVQELAWFEELGLWARAEWTQEAAGYLRRREYRYFSPVFLLRKDDRKIVNLYNIALTNQPRMMNIQALISKDGWTDGPRERRSQMLDRIKRLLGLAESAGEEETLLQVERLKRQSDVPGTGTADPAPDSGGTEAAGLKSLFEALKKDHEALKREFSQRESEARVKAALAEGKITPAQEAWARAYALKDPQGFEAFAAGAPQAVPLDKLPAGDTEQRSGTAAEQVARLTAKMMKETAGLTYQEAMNRVAARHPEIVKEYLEAGRTRQV